MTWNMWNLPAEFICGHALRRDGMKPMFLLLQGDSGKETSWNLSTGPLCPWVGTTRCQASPLHDHPMPNPYRYDPTVSISSFSQIYKTMPMIRCPVGCGRAGRAWVSTSQDAEILGYSTKKRPPCAFLPFFPSFLSTNNVFWMLLILIWCRDDPAWRRWQYWKIKSCRGVAIPWLLLSYGFQCTRALNNVERNLLGRRSIGKNVGF